MPPEQREPAAERAIEGLAVRMRETRVRLIVSQDYRVQLIEKVPECVR